MQRFLTIVSAGVLLAAPALGYPGGTPGFQTDVAPYCAGCHSSRTEEMLAGSGPRAQKELPGAKHYPKISAGKGRPLLSQIKAARILLVRGRRNAAI